MTKNRTNVEDVDRSLYDFSYGQAADTLESGLTPEIVREISAEKNEPDWMLEHRLKSLEIYNKIPVPDWGRGKIGRASCRERV